MKLDPTNHRHYDIICAMRGPDSNSDPQSNVKYYTASVIRWLVGCRSSKNIYATIKNPAELMLQPPPAELESALRKLPHYRSHFRHALYALVDLNIRGARTYLCYLVIHGVIPPYPTV